MQDRAQDALRRLMSTKSGGQMIVQYSSKANSWQTFTHAVKFATNKLEFADGSKHWHLVHVAGYCNSVGMDQDFCEKMAVKYYSDKTSISDIGITTPISSVYRSYKSQFGTKKLPPPPYSIKQLKWLLSKFSKSLLKKYIYQFGNESFTGERPHTIQVSSKLLAFTMWIIAPEYCWSIHPSDEVFTNDECKDSIPENCYLDTCNGSRVWCDNKNNYPITWNV